MRRSLIASQLLAAASALNVPRDLLARQNSNTTSHTVKLTANSYGLRFNAPVTIGGETFELLLDTGSSDTFVLEDDFQCLQPADSSGEEYELVTQSQCGFEGNKYSINDSNTYERISNESFLASYGAGLAQGLMAYEDIEMGGVAVTDQRFGLVNTTTVVGLGGAGVLGLAYPIITSAYDNENVRNGTDASGEDEEEGLSNEPYPPLFVSMYRRGLIAPYFSLALERLDSSQESGDGGVMVLGGLPDVEIKDNYTTVPAEIYEDAELRASNGSEVRSYWATTVDKISYGDSEYTESYQTIVDSGAPMNYVPRSVADGWVAKFSTPGQWTESAQGYLVDCDDEVPSFSVELGGTSFTLDSRDLVVDTGEELAGTKICLSAITRAQEMSVNAEDPSETTELYILGAAFLKGVVAVFDFGNSEMRFAERETTSAGVSLGPLGGGWFVVLGAVVVAVQGLL